MRLLTGRGRFAGPPEEGSGLRAWWRNWVNPSGVDDPDVDDDQSAAALDTELIQEDRKFFSRRGPGRQRDEL